MPKRIEPLDVWLYGKRLATLTQPDPRRIFYRLDFTEEAFDTYGEGRRVLSLALPISRVPAADATGGRLPVTNFLEGVLPEGNLRQQLASAQRVATSDLMALLEVVGGDCAGAVQFLHGGDTPPKPFVRELTREQITRMVTDLPTYSLPDGGMPQASLAGIQDKLLLTDLGGGRWGLPENGAASTHIVKPEPRQGAIPDLIDAEDWALRVAAAAGLPASESRIEQFGPRRALVITRYDRDKVSGRIHQEDLCQALGLPPLNKYETLREARSQGSRLSRVIASAAAQAAGDPTELRTGLLSQVVYNIAMGNGDAHSKNYSMLIGKRGEVSLAPLYDCAPVMFIAERFNSIGHIINGKTSIPEVTADDLVAESKTWGLPVRLAQRTIESTLDATRSAVERTPNPSALRQMRVNLDAFWNRKLWPAPSTGGRLRDGVEREGR